MTETLLERGDNVFATLRKPDRLKKLQEQYPEQLSVARLELTDKNEIKTVVEQAFTSMGSIDVLVSNAGYGLIGAVEELSEESIEHIIDVNLLGSILLIKSAIPFLRKQKNGGHIIQVSSEGGQYAYPGFSLYHATKWGIEGFIESVAKDMEPFNVRFTIAEPGPTGTNFASGLVISDTLDDYRDTPADEVRKLLADGGFGELDDVDKVVQAIIDTADQEKPPLRAAIGDVAVKNVQSALKERLENSNFVKI